MKTKRLGFNRSSNQLSCAALLLSMALSAPALAGGFDVARLSVSQSGVHEVSFDALSAAGIDLSGVALSRLGIESKGEAIALEMLDDGNGVVDSGDGFRFIGEGVDTLYTDTRIYTLKIDGAAVRMGSHDDPLPSGPSAPSYQAKSEYAPQTVYSLTSPTDDPWYALRMLSFEQSVVEETISLPIDNYASGGSAPNLTVKLWGDSELEGAQADHHVEIFMNGVKVNDTQFDGITAYEVNEDLSLGSLSDGAVVKLRVPGVSGKLFDAINLDEISLTYPRQFVADGARLTFSSTWPKFRMSGFESSSIAAYADDGEGNIIRINNLISGGNCSAQSASCEAIFGGVAGAATYYAVTDGGAYAPGIDIPLADEQIDSAADVVVIAHPSFIDASGQPLEGYVAQLASENTGGALLVDVEQIYAKYADGEFGAGAISDYIQAAYARGTKSIVLVGADVFDYRDYKQNNSISFIPSVYVATNNVISFTPSDPKYADVDDDDVPDLVIARLPVRTVSELNILLGKRNAYKNNSYASTAVFAADKTSAIDQYDFGANTDALINNHFGGWNVTTAYLDDMSAEVAGQLVSNKINSGSALTVYSGHSSADQLSFDGLFDGADAQGLSNAGSPTVITQWGCWNTYNVNPETESLSHQFLLSGAQGAAAVLGSSVVGKAGAEQILADLFYAELTQGKTLGEALLLAKQAYASNNGQDLDVLLGVTEMGFPGLSVQ